MTNALRLGTWFIGGLSLVACGGGGGNGSDAAMDANAVDASDARPDGAMTDAAGGDAGNGTYVPDPFCPMRGACFELPAPTGRTLYGVRAVSANEVWFVGERGTVMLYDGTRFIGMSGASPTSLREVDVSPTYVWVVGDAGTILRGRRDARPLALVPLDAGIASGNVSSVWAADDTHVWFGLEDGAIVFYDGATFSTQTMDTGFFTALSGLDATHIWAVGSHSPNFTEYAWDGATWSSTTTIPGQSGGPYAKIHAFAANDIWSTAFSGSLFHYDGSSWSDSGQMVYPATGMTGVGGALYVSGGMSVQRMVGGVLQPLTLPVTSSEWEDVSGTDADGVWAVGDFGAIAHGVPPTLTSVGTWEDVSGLATISVASDVVVAAGRITVMHDAQGWRRIASPLRTPTDLHAFSATNLWAITPAGIERFDGTSWTTMTSTVTPIAIRGFSPSDLYVGGTVANAFGMLHWDGTSLQVEPSDGPVSGAVLDLGGTSDNVWAITDTHAVLHRENGTWVVKRPAGTSRSSFAHLAVLGAQDVMAFFALATEHERWNGTTWSVMPRTPFGGPRAVYVSPENIPVIAGTDGLFVLRNGSWVGSTGEDMADIAGGGAGVFALTRYGQVMRVDVDMLGP